MSRGSTPRLIERLWHVASLPLVIASLCSLSALLILGPRDLLPPILELWCALLTVASAVAFASRFCLEGPRGALVSAVSALGFKVWSLPLFDSELKGAARLSNPARSPLLLGVALTLAGALSLPGFLLLSQILSPPPATLALSPGDVGDAAILPAGDNVPLPRMLGLNVRLVAFGSDQADRRVAALEFEDLQSGARAQSILRPGKPLNAGRWAMRLQAIETMSAPGSLELQVHYADSDRTETLRVGPAQTAQVPDTEISIGWRREATAASPNHGNAVDLELRAGSVEPSFTRLHESNLIPVELPSLGISLSWGGLQPGEQVVIQVSDRSAEPLAWLPMISLLLVIAGIALTLPNSTAIIGRDGDAVLVARPQSTKLRALREALPVSDDEWQQWLRGRDA